MMILDRYIQREIAKPAVVICTILVFVFGCYIAARYLEDAVEGQLSGMVVFFLIVLRILIALEVLLPMTLYLSVIIALGRLYGDSEMMAISACGIATGRVMRSVFLMGILVGGVTACFSLHIRPWAWERFYELKARALVNFDLTRMQGGNFYEIENGDRVIFADRVDGQANYARKIFIQTRQDRELQIIFAQEARQRRDEKTGRPVLEFKDGYFYEFSTVKNQGRIMHFGTSMIRMEPRDPRRDFKIKAATTASLAGSEDPEKIAELQWRLSSPFSAVLLAPIGAALARPSPRRGKYAKMPAAVVVFAIYYNLSAVAKKWVGQGVLTTFPGVWWVQIMMAVLVGAILWRPRITIFRKA